MRKPMLWMMTLALAAAPAARAEEARRTVSLAGTAMVKSAPDEVLIVFGVEVPKELPASRRRDYVVGAADTLSVSAPLLSEAQAQAETAVRGVREALKKLGVEDRALQTESFQVEPRVWNDDGVTYFRGYMCRQSMMLRLKEPSKADACVDAVLKHGATHIYAVTFNASKVRQLRDEARKAACKAAREKADLLAGELGAKVKRVLVVSEGGNAVFCGKSWQGRGYGGYQQSEYAQNVIQMNEFIPAAPAGGGETEAGELSSGEVGVSASVSVVFELE